MPVHIGVQEVCGFACLCPIIGLNCISDYSSVLPFLAAV